MRIKSLLFLFLLFPVHALHAQTHPIELEGGVDYQQLNNDFPNWRGAYIRSIFGTSPKDTWYAEVFRRSEWDETATLFSLGDSHTINEDWYTYLAAGGSSSGFSFPRARVDGEVSRKWLDRRRLVTSVGAGFIDWRTDHHDASVWLGGIYYFSKPWIVQGGVRWNVSNPGAVISRSQYIALMQGSEGHHYVVLRAEIGREAYQAIGPNIALVDFPSQNVSLRWKKWVGHDWGFNTIGEYYTSDFYHRAGGSFGLFKSF